MEDAILEEIQKVAVTVLELRAKVVKRALNKMKSGKAPGPSEFQIGMIKKLGRDGEEVMFESLRAILNRTGFLRCYRNKSI